MSGLQVALQIVVGIVMVVAVYWLSLWAMRADRMVVSDKPSIDNKQQIKVVDGYALAGMASGRSWSTINPSARSFVAMPRSYNRRGGAQFTYSFWLFLEDVTPSNVANRDLLIRGDKRKYTFGKTTMLGNADSVSLAITAPAAPGGGPAAGGAGAVDPRRVSGVYDDVLVKCPRVRFGSSFDSLVIEFNTLHNPDERVDVTPHSGNADPSLRKNLIKLAQNKWVLYTITFEDNVAINEFEDGILVRVYVNDVQYQTSRVRSALRQNNGDMHLLPMHEEQDAVKGLRIGNVFYYNYALGNPQVRELYRAGPPRHMAKDIMGDRSMLGDPLHLSEYNRLDIYNS